MTHTTELKRGYEVEWHADCPRDEFGELDIDRAETHLDVFATLEEARTWAKQKLNEDCFGSVLIRDFAFVEYDDEGLPVFCREYGTLLEEES
jgi:hypothetical protein